MKFSRFLLFLASLLIINQGLAESSDDDNKSNNIGPAHYMELKPPFVVNVSDGERVRHMQITAQVKLNSADISQYVELHNPAIRHAMIMLLSGQPVAELRTVQGKEKLREQALITLQKLLEENIGAPGIEAVYFTGLIIQ